MTDPTVPPLPAERPGYRYVVLALLVVVYTFNFIDRQIIGILAGSIKRDLELTDTQLGLMGGLAFALFYTGLGIPIAWLADRFNRVTIVGVSLGLWSAFTALCGLAQGFWHLFLARLGVGVGEAGGVAPSYSIIADYFPPSERARALAVFSFGIPIGSALGVLFGGLIAAQVDWRAAFFVVGLAGVVLTPVFLAVVKEPPRGRYDPGPKLAPPPFLTVLRTVAAKPAFWFVSFGASMSSVMGYGLIFWLPSFFERSFQMSLVDRSWYYAAIIFFGGVGGIWLGGWLADRLAHRSKAWFALAPAIAFILAAPCYAVGMMNSDLVVGFFLFLVPQALSLLWLGPVIAAVQGMAPLEMRASASAIFLFVNNLIGIGLGTLLLGRISESLAPIYGDESLRYAILYCTGFYVLAAVFMLLASRRLERDWV